MNAKLSAVLVTLLATFNVNASLNMTAAPSNHGTWVKVTESHSPVAGAEVVTNSPIQEALFTDENGRVFIQKNSHWANSLRVTATTPNGEEVTKLVYVPRSSER
ncbi:hypothetical protein [Photobacterium minamisatsumaniensis]|uniref:hypothetical protein n=1 Tax=Photobacterium minamisatsumaniensis TaxID=2910233 RepID=UPI003D09A77C